MGCGCPARLYAVAAGHDNAELVIDETGFLKQGKASYRVGRQYTGSAGKVTNCQNGVFAAYVSARGHALVDRALYLPKGWISDPARLAAAHVPEGTAFATKPALAVKMIERAFTAGMPFASIAANAVYDVGAIEQVLRRAGKGYVLGVKGDHRFVSGATSRSSRAPPRRSKMTLILLPGSVCRRDRVPRANASVTGPFPNSPTSKPRITSMAQPGHGPEAC